MSDEWMEHCVCSLLTGSCISRFLVESARALGLEVIDRCNLTVLLEPGQEHLAQFLADNEASLTLPAGTQASCTAVCPSNTTSRLHNGYLLTLEGCTGEADHPWSLPASEHYAILPHVHASTPLPWSATLSCSTLWHCELVLVH